MPETTKPVVQLSGIDGNAFMILGACLKAARKAKMSKEWQDKFLNEAKAGDYDHLLQTAIKYFDVDGDEEDNYCEDCGSEIESPGQCEDCENDEAEEEDES
jgi:hypothetical protein